MVKLTPEHDDSVAPARIRPALATWVSPVHDNVRGPGYYH